MNDRDLDPRQQQRVNEAERALKARLNACREAGPMTVAVVEKMLAVVHGHHRECRSRGIPFPRLAPFVLPRHNYVQWYRRDLEPHGISVALKQITEAFPDITPRELAEGAMGCWPDLKPERSEVGNVRPLIAVN